MRPLPFPQRIRTVHVRPIVGATTCDEDGVENAVREAVLFEENPPRLWHFVCPQCGDAVRWQRWIGVLVCPKCQVRMGLRCIPIPKLPKVTNGPGERRN